MNKKILTGIIIDWFTIIIIILPYFCFPKPSPHKRNFSITDTSISHPYKGEEQISDGLLTIIAVTVPLVVSFALIIITKGGAYEYNQFLLAMFASIGISLELSEFVKALFGRFRPDFLSRCQINTDMVKEIIAGQYIVDGLPVGHDRLFDLSICTNPNTKILDEGRRSFPSGHSSTICSTFVLLTFYLAGKLRVFDHRVYIWRLVISILPIFGAIYIMSTRHQDNLHHWSDLLGGAILGSLVAIIIYHFFYPPVTSFYSNKPYRYRINQILSDESHPINDSESVNPSLDKDIAKLV
ncbi:PAP2-domain-containing protein [Neocallimastix sp. 'constans']